MKTKPLIDKTILLACSATKMLELASGLEAMGGKVIPFPAIEIRDIEDKRSLDQALDSLSEYAWIIFTSVHGVSFFARRLNERGIICAPSSMPKICAIGPATAKAVNDFGYEVALIPERFIAEGIIEALGTRSGGLNSLAGKRILLARAKEGRETLPDELRASGVRVDVVPCYQTVRPELAGDQVRRLRGLRPDLVVLTSSSTLRNMIGIIGQEDGKRILLESVVAVLGPMTGSTARSFGKHVEIVPKENTIASLLTEIHEFFGGRNFAISRQ